MNSVGVSSPSSITPCGHSIIGSVSACSSICLASITSASLHTSITSASLQIIHSIHVIELFIKLNAKQTSPNKSSDCLVSCSFFKPRIRMASNVALLRFGSNIVLTQHNVSGVRGDIGWYWVSIVVVFHQQII